MSGCEVSGHIRARGSGAVTHNRATEHGELEITVWGECEAPPAWLRGREAGVVLDEEAVRVLLAHLERSGLLLR